MNEPEFPSPTILDSRRLFGANLFSLRPGAVLEVDSTLASSEEAIARWPLEVTRLSTALGWTGVQCERRASSKTTHLFLSAPVDGLMSATELAEHAWVAAETYASGAIAPDAIAHLRETYTRERQSMPFLVATESYARSRSLVFSLDDDGCSVGSGTGVRVVTHSDTPFDDASEFDDAWSVIHDVPIALVTGSNGKTTTTRLVAAMWREASRVTGWCCSDGVWTDDEQRATGDYTGPGGARLVLCDNRVQAAVLETARGGMLRRGLATTQADGAIITNISADHFGEYGVESLHDLADAKAIVTRVLRPGARLVLNADDPTLVALARSQSVPIAWFSATPNLPANSASGAGVLVRNGELLLHTAGESISLGRVNDMPITLGGRAQHNIANAAGAALLGFVVGVPVSAIRKALAQFGSAAGDNPGRLMIRQIGGVTIVMDYAHNPDGITSLCRTAASMPANRRLLLIGQAGNRDDEQLRALAAAAWTTQQFDRVIVKELSEMRRGRELGAVPEVLRSALLDAGAPMQAIELVNSELEGVRAALMWAMPGDVLVLGVHSDRHRVLQLMDTLSKSGWNAGDTVLEA